MFEDRFGGRRGEREDARGGGPPGYPKALPLYLVERKEKREKGKKGRELWEPMKITRAIYTLLD